MIKNVDQFLEGLLKDFNPKQRRVIVGRFGLKTGEKATLQEIGDELGVTRERVRQIEEDGLKKLSQKTKEEAAPLLEFAKTHLASCGGVRRDDYLLNDVGNLLFARSGTKHLSPKLRFIFLASNTPFYSKENDDFHSFWYVDDNSKKKFLEFVKNITNIFKANQTPAEADYKKYLAGVNDFSSTHLLLIPKYFGQNVFGDFGLRSSPEIEPRTIRDKIYLALKKHGEPLHFSDIAKFVTKMGIDKKIAHVQTVHNELIKDDRFVLVGRGIYALQEKGFEPGTVKEVIAKILKKKGPMHSSDVVSLVNQQRFLKENTILLSLQNRRHFRRLEDGRYHVKEA